MIRVLFLCHGNICRSSAAEYVFKHLLEEKGRENEFSVFSRGVSDEERGNDIYPPMKQALAKAKIPFGHHSAMRITQDDYDNADAIFYMDQSNIRLLSWRIEDRRHICHPLFEFTPGLYEIEDPWYSGEYDKVLGEITRCCEDILDNIEKII